MKRLTLEEIGKLAGVSRATVSRVINDHPNIRREVRDRVQRVISETGYQPNLVARSLASRETKILGLIIPSVIQEVFSDPYYPRLTQGIAQGCNENDYTLSLFLFSSKEEEKHTLKRLIGNGLVDGLIVAADNLNDPFVPALVGHQIPVVQVGRPSHTTPISYVDVDNVHGGYLATEHLIKQGYQRIGQITTHRFVVTVDRNAGFRKALNDHGMTIDQSLIAYGDFSEESGYQAMKSLLPKAPDAVFAISDLMALGALRAIREANLRTPDDIAVVGFDDLAPAIQADPPLTTIRQPVRQTGVVAVETLLRILHEPVEAPYQIVLPVELIVRASTGTAK